MPSVYRPNPGFRSKWEVTSRYHKDYCKICCYLRVRLGFGTVCVPCDHLSYARRAFISNETCRLSLPERAQIHIGKGRQLEAWKDITEFAGITNPLRLATTILVPSFCFEHPDCIAWAYDTHPSSTGTRVSGSCQPEIHWQTLLTVTSLTSEVGSQTSARPPTCPVVLQTCMYSYQMRHCSTLLANADFQGSEVTRRGGEGRIPTRS